MNHGLSIVGTAIAWAAGGAVAAWLLTWPLRRRSQAGLLISLSLVTTVASVSAVFGNVRAMFVAADDAWVTVTAALVAGAVAAAAAASAARGFARDKADLLDAIGALRDGRVRPGADRRLSGQLAAVRNELDETARTLTAARDHERALEQSRRDLLAWMSHDLRTPLAGLRAMSEALEDGVAASPERYHKQIRIEVDRLTGMVEDLFEISRLQSDGSRPRQDRVDLVDLVSDCLAALDPLAEAHDVRLTGHAEPGVALDVDGDSAELNRALTNLLANAIRHTVPGGTVTVGLNRTPMNGRERAEIDVRDECGGIEETALDKVFDVGFRGEPARTPVNEIAAGSGAGMGLAIARGIVAAHHGTIEVRNIERGCAFTMRLPVA